MAYLSAIRNAVMNGVDLGPPPFDPNQFYDYVDAHEGQYIERLREIVAMRGVRLDPSYTAELARTADWYQGWAEHLGGTCKRVPRSGSSSKGDPSHSVLEISFGEDPAKKTVCAWSHLDVCPAQSKEWATDPWVLTEQDGKLYGRGTTDNKAPAVSWLWVVEAFKAVDHEMAVNLKMFIEVAEEEDTTSLEELVLQEAQSSSGFLSNVDSFCLSANSWLGPDRPCLTYGLRGLLHFSITVTMGTKDLASGCHGGILHEPMVDIAYLASSLIDKTGVILVPGVNELVAPLTEDERAQYDGIDFETAQYRAGLGILGELAHTTAEAVLMHRWRYPTLSIHSIGSVCAPEGEAHLISAAATLKFSMRLVPDMDLLEVERLTRRHLAHVFARLGHGNQLSLEVTPGARPWLTEWHHPNYEAAKRAVVDVYNQEPDMTREGSSIAIASIFEEVTGKSVCLVPLGASDDQSQGPNEKVDKAHYVNGIKVLGMYLEELAKK